MSRLHTATPVLFAATMLLAFACGGQAQEALTARVEPTGLILVSSGGSEAAMIELNAHGPGWDHAPQDSADGQFTGFFDESVQITGTLPVPSTDGGAIDFRQTVTELPQGLRLEYDLTIAQAMRLSGLQLSVNLPVEAYAGSEVMIRQPYGDPDITGLPEETEEGRTQLWRGDGATVEVAAESDQPVTIQLRAATDVVIQDLRQWEHDVFEIRFPAIMNEPGPQLAAGDRFHLDLTVDFGAPVEVETPAQ